MSSSHAHTETSDILGGQRPSRSHEADAVVFKQNVSRYVQQYGSGLSLPEGVSADNAEQWGA